MSGFLIPENFERTNYSGVLKIRRGGGGDGGNNNDAIFTFRMENVHVVSENKSSRRFSFQSSRLLCDKK